MHPAKKVAPPKSQCKPFLQARALTLAIVAVMFVISAGQDESLGAPDGRVLDAIVVGEEKRRRHRAFARDLTISEVGGG
ncbi:hypothetical protein CLAFUW4_20029 [Fulvia fulva]|uniref:uncharacterized protein n=1 Tax=Passalora fulva TaxID=5499 RepID=UPI002852CF69|nr:uncharacterized protein CLAFUR5_20029 [Fulvia fulva]KAK4626259.1 hypothetical protein CLAFUR4_20029 [Fulvia fulva]KAK4627851.1 hypothetical protein CLAFUR0_20029 [Fulvia fulva]WMI38853.1 hypothetical protein CLAFUR5_20029 [Fulvia fulva]WPV13413.1 hypothetical protein CLAFUW4_20029 [Fulvia fulva]WPV29172.1 hypothetical protein CLAFUW7_20029 [Fulvia fulva]